MSSPSWAFIIKTAWRESKRQRGRLFLCAISILFGVAALVAVDSFTVNLKAGLDAEAKALLGADMQLSSRSGFDANAERLFERIGGDQSKEIRFASMAYFPKQDTSRLIQVRALEGGFPFFGEFETEPAGVDIANSNQASIVLDPIIMRQQELSVGDQVRLGDTDFTIVAELIRVPGEAAFAGIFAPRAYIPLSQLESTGLIGQGSIAFYRLYFANLPKPPKELIAENKTEIDAAYLRAETVEDRKRRVGRPLDNLSNFLGLVGFVALLLGGVGIAGAVQAYLVQKKDTVAILRCLGSSSQQATRIFGIQILGIAIIGAVSGALAGILCQAALPRVLAPVLPFELDFFISWSSALSGTLYGAFAALLAGLFPLLPLRKISPLRALRADFEPAGSRKDPIIRMLGVLTLVAITVFAATRTAVWWHGLVFVGGLGCALSIFWLTAILLKTVLRRVVRPKSFCLQQATTNLHRPKNKTVYLTVSLGVGTFLIYTLTLIQTGLLQQTELAEQSDAPNLLFFDIQPDQLDGLEAILDESGLSFATSTPVVTMRLSAVKGQSVTSIKQDPELNIPNWILNREWRSTYRGELGKAETLADGNYVADWSGQAEPIPISLEDDMARELSVTLGDNLTFDVQGIPIEVTVSSLRTVDWAQMWPNFFATFPLGVLEEAPQWWIAVTRSPDTETTAKLQSQTFREYPNISAVDLNVVIDALQNVFGRINFAVRFMGIFTMATGIIILANTISANRHQRIAESTLLRTLGANGRQIRTIFLTEYALIGFISGLVGVLLALGAGFALGIWVFKVDFYIPWLQVLGAIGSVVLIAAITGLLCSRGISSSPPLKILRSQ